MELLHLKVRLNDFASPLLEEQKKNYGIADRADIQTILDLMDYDEKRKS